MGVFYLIILAVNIQLMRKTILLLTSVMLSIVSMAQITFIIEDLPSTTPDEDFVYIAGTMNGWSPGADDFRLEKNTDGKFQIILEEQSEGTTIAFKFTRGGWETVEKDENGQEMGDRQFTYGNNETINFSIATWADGGSGGGGTTAAENVSVLSEDFYMLQLDRNRRIWVYLPPDYEESQMNYPVLYMHDGQNLFDSFTSFSGEWEVDETLNDLAEQGIQVPIVIGIDNGGGHRLDEYSAWVNSQYGGGEGRGYMEFIVETLKPYIDENYRTLSDKDNTGLMGSSLGGLISQFGVFQHSDVFTKAGLFSPSYWYSDSIWAFTQENAHSFGQRIYQLAGSLEGDDMVQDMEMMHDNLLSYGFSNEQLVSKVVVGQGHNEAFWRSEFEEAYLWLFSDFANGVSDLVSANKLLLSPNPAKDLLLIDLKQIDSIYVYNIKGEVTMELKNVPGQAVDIHDLPSGLYFVRIYSEKLSYSEKFIKL